MFTVQFVYTHRLAFKCQIVHAITDKDYSKTLLPDLKVFKEKRKTGTVERVSVEMTK